MWFYFIIFMILLERGKMEGGICVVPFFLIVLGGVKLGGKCVVPFYNFYDTTRTR